MPVTISALQGLRRDERVEASKFIDTGVTRSTVTGSIMNSGRQSYHHLPRARPAYFGGHRIAHVRYQRCSTDKWADLR